VLAYNENPFGIFPAARDAIVAAAEKGNRYPKQTADELRDVIAQRLDVDAEMVVLGSGSIEPLKIALLHAGPRTSSGRADLRGRGLVCGAR